MPHKNGVTVIGAGLAGSEAAWQLARRGIPVRLIEMRPVKNTPAHETDGFGELVCSNSLGADVLTSPAGILKAELRKLDSLIMAAADENRVPAGRALAVDREGFSRHITRALEEHPLVTVEHMEMDRIPSGPVVLATGPLTSPALAVELQKTVGQDFLAFFDAVAPVVTLDSVDMDIAFRGSRYGQGDDYINCPMDDEQYQRFWEALTTAETVPRKDFEKDLRYFEGCLPVEIIGSRGRDTLRFGPLRPVGISDPRQPGKEFSAVVQLRQDNSEGTLFNLVGFQTNLRWGEQERVFRLIPGLEKAEFVRFGVMHRNIYVNAPAVVDPFLRIGGREDLFLAGQIVGVEGYMESTAMGLVAGLNMAAMLRDRAFPDWPRETAIGSLLFYLKDARPGAFQPMNVNLGIFPRLPQKIRKRTERCEKVAEKAVQALDVFMGETDLS